MGFVSGGPLLQVNGFTSRASPSPQRMDSLHGGPLLQSEWDLPQGAPPLHSEWDSLQGSLLLQSEWDSPPGGPPYPGGPLLQVNEIHLKGLPLSTANGIRFKGVPFSKANWLSSLHGGKKDVPVRGPLLRSHNLAPSLHEDYGSHFRHPPQV